MPAHRHDLSRLESHIRQTLYGSGSQDVVGVRRVCPQDWVSFKSFDTDNLTSILVPEQL